jgi:hypothetical protein
MPPRYLRKEQGKVLMSHHSFGIVRQLEHSHFTELAEVAASTISLRLGWTHGTIQIRKYIYRV